ncbi:uncharacterized protein LOC124886560 [Capsicum annuum]|uniref:uncharacterized protein LOC124886560 n=1 Tax=Capsicum annuum TaxID=4072 RepID=UPI001FB053A9|nr:uncharacterized protein LOC124886560 [Capsicum annuum]
MVYKATATAPEVDNLGRALVANREDAVYTLVLIILEHFNGRFTNQHISPNCKLQKLKSLGLANDVPDQVYGLLYTSGSKSDYNAESESENDIELPDLSDSDNTNACLDCQGDFCTQFVVPDPTISKKKSHRYSKDDKPYRKERSRSRSKEEHEARKAYRKSTRFMQNRSKRDLAKIKCYKCGEFGHISPNCKLEKLKSLELDKDLHGKVYGLLYTSGSESDYNSESKSDNEVDLLDLSDSDKNVDTTCSDCKGHTCTCDDAFYKLQSQFED